ncbi:MAG TPA: hypothetical protein VM901_07365 [Bdellovibrionota bacterium]|jgi:hypothetical protein|nr:hypothetical protein [Bdellovibrionota bacterium]
MKFSLITLCSVAAAFTAASAESYRIPYTNNAQGVMAEYSHKFQTWSVRWPSAAGKTLSVRVPKGKTLQETADCKGVASLVEMASTSESIRNHIRGKLLVKDKAVQTKWRILDLHPSDAVFLENAKKLLERTGYSGEGLILEAGSMAYRMQDAKVEFAWADDAYSKVIGTEDIEKAYRTKFAEIAFTASVASGPMNVGIREKDFLCDLVEGKVSITYNTGIKQALMAAVNPKLTERDVIQMHEDLVGQEGVVARNVDEQRFAWGYKTQGSLVEVLRQGSSKINDEDFVRLFSLLFFEQNDRLVFQSKDAIRVNFRKFNFADVAEDVVETPIKVVFARDSIVAESEAGHE